MTILTIEQKAQHLADARPSKLATDVRTRIPASLVSFDDSNPAFLRLDLRHEHDLLINNLTAPGQYTTLSYGQLAPRYLVIASSPKEDPGIWSFLISKDSTLGRTIRGTSPLAFSLSVPEGQGFKPQLWRDDVDEDLLLFCSGSGIATLRALLIHLEHMAPHRIQKTHLYFGLGLPQETPYSALLSRWRTLGMKQHFAFDHLPQGPHYVQHAFEQSPVSLSGAQVALSGSSIMIRETSKYLMRQGLPFEHLHLNVEVAKID